MGSVARPPAGGDARLGPPAPLLEVRGVSKSFGSFRALDNITLSVNRQEVVGFIGENGAGKSTLLNIMSGVSRQDEGDMLMHGKPVSFTSYRQATHAGVFRIFQELALVPTLTVYENLFLSHEEHFSRAGVISRRAMVRRARQMLAEFDHGWVDPARETASYDFSTRQVIEIIKAFALAELLEIESPVILLDEPTAGLAKDEIDFFSTVVRQIKERAGVIFVSHRLSELLDLSDRIYVIKDGVVVAQPSPHEITEADLHHLMVGRKRDEQFYKERLQREPEDKVALSLSRLTARGQFEDVDIKLRAGEIVGLAGVVGAGKSEVARAAFGATKNVEGEIAVDGTRIERPTIASMMSAGVGYVSDDRARDGIILGLPIAWNVSLATLANGPSARPFLDLDGERKRAEEYVAALRIKSEGVDARASSLSGGTQQKVILARWLARGVRVLILDNPTKGIDAGAKEDIYEILRDLTQRGTAIVLVSDELVELIGLSNRVLVMKDGRVIREVQTPPDAKPAEAELVAHMV